MSVSLSNGNTFENSKTHLAESKVDDVRLRWGDLGLFASVYILE
jgi:hypothetical protein